jgi:hypothetical protein
MASEEVGREAALGFGVLVRSDMIHLDSSDFLFPLNPKRTRGPNCETNWILSAPNSTGSPPSHGATAVKGPLDGTNSACPLRNEKRRQNELPRAKRTPRAKLGNELDPVHPRKNEANSTGSPPLHEATAAKGRLTERTPVGRASPDLKTRSQSDGCNRGARQFQYLLELTNARRRVGWKWLTVKNIHFAGEVSRGL